MAQIKESTASPTVKLGFKFLVHTAIRSREAREATWDEIHLKKGLDDTGPPDEIAAGTPGAPHRRNYWDSVRGSEAGRR